MEEKINYSYEPCFEDLSVHRQLAILYQPDTDYSTLSASLALFVAKPDLDIEAILAFEKEVQADYLIAIITDNVGHSCLAIANRLIYCQSADIKDLVQALTMMSGEKAFITVDASDFKQGFENCNSASFISFHTSLDRLQQDLPNYQHQLKQETSSFLGIKSLITHVTCTEGFNFEDHDKINEVNQSVLAKDLNVFCSIAFTEDTTDCHIANLVFWQDDNRPQILSTRLQNQLPLAKEQLDVVLLSLLANKPSVPAKNAIHLFIGYQQAKQAVFLNLVQAPHLLMAGCSRDTTTKMLHTFMVSMLMQYSPDQVKLMLIDSENPVFTDYQNLPHLISTISNRENATQSLAWCQLEMERRFNLLRQTSSRNIADFNQKIEEANKISNLMASYRFSDKSNVNCEQICVLLQPLPRIVVVVSELKELMLDSTLPNEELITDIAIRARAVGIHLILATNHPHVDVLTDLIKSHIPTRLSFEVNTKADSLAILDSLGAELLNDEDMLFLPSYSNEPKYLQSIFATQSEINQACEQWQLNEKQNYAATHSQEINELIEAYIQEMPKRFYDPSQPDPLYEEVVSFIKEGGKVSAANVQRKFSIGYNRAARLIDRMEAEGIVSAMSKDGKRTLL